MCKIKKKSSLKSSIGGEYKEKFKILIIVDVQNCFINGGSLGNESMQDSIKQVSQIEDLIDKNELIIFTRDYHPIGHSSFIQNDGVFLPHCRNTNAICNGKNIETIPSYNNKLSNVTNENEGKLKLSLDDTVIFDVKYKDHIIKGTDLSYLFLSTKYAGIIKELIDNNDNRYTIGLKKNTFFGNMWEFNFQNNYEKGPNIDNIDYQKQTLVLNHEGTEKYFCQLTKGELCNYESYSAFNYHLDYTKGFKNAELMPCISENSTGLCEFINKFIEEKGYIDSNKKNIEITVCGLVGNICVMHTVHQGLIMTNLINKNLSTRTIDHYYYSHLKGAKFIYSCPGTLWLPDEYAKRNIDGYKLERANPNMIKDDEVEFIGELKGLKNNAEETIEINEFNDEFKYDMILNDETTITINYNNSADNSCTIYE